MRRHCTRVAGRRVAVETVGAPAKGGPRNSSKLDLSGAPLTSDGVATIASASISKLILAKTPLADPDLLKFADSDRISELDDKYPAYRNDDPQWWDASQVYGEREEETRDLRTSRVTAQLCPGGKLYVDDDGFLPHDPKTKNTVSGFTDNWWLGLEILHTLFAKDQRNKTETAFFLMHQNWLIAMINVHWYIDMSVDK